MCILSFFTVSTCLACLWQGLLGSVLLMILLFVLMVCWRPVILEYSEPVSARFFGVIYKT